MVYGAAGDQAPDARRIAGGFREHEGCAAASIRCVHGYFALPCCQHADDVCPTMAWLTRRPAMGAARASSARLHGVVQRRHSGIVSGADFRVFPLHQVLHDCLVPRCRGIHQRRAPTGIPPICRHANRMSATYPGEPIEHAAAITARSWTRSRPVLRQQRSQRVDPAQDRVLYHHCALLLESLLLTPAYRELLQLCADEQCLRPSHATDPTVHIAGGNSRSAHASLAQLQDLHPAADAEIDALRAAQILCGPEGDWVMPASELEADLEV
mmetsp:Transcript_104761/g.303189  ORF Transcript_104761/g.303189 Transcript_104761/m.303189 type:complete len:269 (-) Transcript_104761:431-1237(-)